MICLVFSGLTGHILLAKKNKLSKRVTVLKHRKFFQEKKGRLRYVHCVVNDIVEDGRGHRMAIYFSHDYLFFLSVDFLFYITQNEKRQTSGYIDN